MPRITIPAELRETIDRHMALFAGFRMVAEDPQPAERLDGIEQAEWDALGDASKQAIGQEREARERAENDLAAARLAGKPKQATKPGAGTEEADSPEKSGDKPDAGDLNALVAQAVAAAIAPLVQQQEQDRAEGKARRVINELRTAAGPRLFDASDAVANIDLTTLTTEAGEPDAAKIAAALDALVAAKPHLAKPADGRRHFDPAAPLGGAAPKQSMDDRVKAALAQMQAAIGLHPDSKI